MAALQAMGWSNPQQFMAPMSAQGRPTPEFLQGQAKAMTDKITADARMMDSLTRAKESEAKMEMDVHRRNIEGMRAEMEDKRVQSASNEKHRDRMSQERIQLLDLAQNIVVHPESAAMVQPLIEPALQNLAQEEQGTP
jgi:hypothetical protein